MRKKIHSWDLGIDIVGDSEKEGEVFKWFLACLLFGKPIRQEVARRTYLEFRKAGILSQQKILDAGWDELVGILDRGGYVRYDFSTATKLLDVCGELKKRYGGIAGLLKTAKDGRDLARRLQEFKGIGPVTTRIFLRDLKKIKAAVK